MGLSGPTHRKRLHHFMEIFANMKKVVDCCGNRTGDRDQTVFFELGIFNIKCLFFRSIMLKAQTKRLRYSHAATR